MTKLDWSRFDRFPGKGYPTPTQRYVRSVRKRTEWDGTISDEDIESALSDFGWSDADESLIAEFKDKYVYGFDIQDGQTAQTHLRENLEFMVTWRTLGAKVRSAGRALGYSLDEYEVEDISDCLLAGPSDYDTVMAAVDREMA